MVLEIRKVNKKKARTKLYNHQMSFGTQKRARQQTINMIVKVCQSATAVFNEGWIIQNILRFCTKAMLKPIRLVVKGGINNLWNSEDVEFAKKFRKDTMEYMSRLFPTFDGYNEIDYYDNDGNLERCEILPRDNDDLFEGLEYLVVSNAKKKERHNHFESYFGTTSYFDAKLRVSKRPDGRCDVFETKSVLGLNGPLLTTRKETERYIIDQPFVRLNQSIKPELWEQIIEQYRNKR